MRGCAAALLSVGVALCFATGALAEKKKLNATDQAAAKVAVLQLADLPTNVRWKGGAIKPDDSSSSFACAGYHPKDADLVMTGEASTKFTAPGTAIGSDVSLLATPKMVALDWQRTFVPIVVPCLRKAFRKGAGGKVKILSAAKIPFPKLTPYAAAYRLVYQVVVKGKPIVGVFDTIALGGNRTEITLFVTGALGAPADQATEEAAVTIFEQHLSQVVVSRAFSAPAAPVA